MSRTTRARDNLAESPKNSAGHAKRGPRRHVADPKSELLALQQAAGNQAVSQLLHGKSGSSRGHGENEPLLAQELAAPSGKPLDAKVQDLMESRFGEDFSDVRVHTDTKANESAKSLGAEAYTTGKDVVFASGRYAPGTLEGQQRLAHELTHVVQQSQSGTALSRESQMSAPHEASEREADAVGRTVAGGSHAPAIAATGVGIQRTNGKSTLLDDFAKKFPDAAKLIQKNAVAMKLVTEAETADVKFGGYSEEGPGKRAWPYTVGKTVYVAKARAEVPVTVSDFLFELNNAIRAPKFAELGKEAAKGSKGKLGAKDYARKIVELEVEGMLRMGAIWFEMKKTGPKGGEWDKYDFEFFLSEFNSVKAGKKTKEDIVKNVLSRVRRHEPHPEWTIEEFYMNQYKEVSGGK